MRIGILVFARVEPLDFAGPFEVFYAASEVQRMAGVPEAERFRPSLVADSHLVTTGGGMVVTPRWLTTLCPRLDLLIVPGGLVDDECKNETLLAWIRDRAAASPIASVCTGSFLLAEAGVLEGHAATTHWADCDDFAERYPTIELRRDSRVVDEWPVVTSAGVSSGIDMSLSIVARVGGSALATDTARYMEYPYPS